MIYRETVVKNGNYTVPSENHNKEQALRSKIYMKRGFLESIHFILWLDVTRGVLDIYRNSDGSFNELKWNMDFFILFYFEKKNVKALQCAVLSDDRIERLIATLEKQYCFTVKEPDEIWWVVQNIE